MQNDYYYAKIKLLTVKKVSSLILFGIIGNSGFPDQADFDLSGILKL